MRTIPNTPTTLVVTEIQSVLVSPLGDPNWRTVQTGCLSCQEVTTLALSTEELLALVMGKRPDKVLPHLAPEGRRWLMGTCPECYLKLDGLARLTGDAWPICDCCGLRFNHQHELAAYESGVRRPDTPWEESFTIAYCARCNLGPCHCDEWERVNLRKLTHVAV